MRTSREAMPKRKLERPRLGAKARSCTGSTTMTTLSTRVQRRLPSQYSYTCTFPLGEGPGSSLPTASIGEWLRLLHRFHGMGSLIFPEYFPAQCNLPQMLATMVKVGLLSNENTKLGECKEGKKKKESGSSAMTFNK